MLKIYLGKSGAGKTHCIKQDIIHYYLLPREGADVYICNGRKEEWKENKFNSAHVQWVNYEKRSSLEPRKKDLVVFDAMELAADDVQALIPVIIRMSQNTNVVISLMEYKDEYKQLFLNAYEICYMRLHAADIDIIPTSFIDDRDKHTLRSLGQQEVCKYYMILYRDGVSTNLTFPVSFY